MGQDTRLNIILSANNSEATRALEATNKQVQEFSDVVSSSNAKMVKSNKQLYETYAYGKEAIEGFLDLFRGAEDGIENMANSNSKLLNSFAKLKIAGEKKSWNELAEAVLAGDKELLKHKKTYEEVVKVHGEFSEAAKKTKKELEAIEKVAGESKLLIKFGENLSKITGGRAGQDVLKLGQNWQSTANKIVDGANKFAKVTELAEIIGRMAYGVYQFTDAMGEVPNKIGEAAGAAEEFIGVLEQNPFIKAAAEIESYEIRLKSLLGSQEAATRALEFMHKEAAAGGFETASMIEAGQVIKEFQLDIEETLPLVEKLAAGTGKELPQAAVALGNAFNGISGGFTQLQRTFRLTKDQLIQVGAATNEYNEITNETTKDILRNQKAIEKLINTKYADVVKEQAQTLKGSFTNFHEAVERLEEGVGNVFKKPVIDIVNKITEVVQKASSVIVPLMDYMQKQGIDLFSPVTFGAKTVIGALDKVASIAVGVKDTFEGLSNNMKPLVAGMAAFTSAAVGFTGALAPLISLTAQFYLMYKATSLAMIGLVAVATAAETATAGIVGLGAAVSMAAWPVKALGGAFAAMSASGATLTAELLAMQAVAIGIGAVIVGVAVAFSFVRQEQQRSAEAQKDYVESLKNTVDAGKRYHNFLGQTAEQTMAVTDSVKENKRAIEEANKSYEDTVSALKGQNTALRITNALSMAYYMSLSNVSEGYKKVGENAEKSGKIEAEIAAAKIARDKKVADAQARINETVKHYQDLLGRNKELLNASGMSSVEAQAGIESLNAALEQANIKYEELIELRKNYSSIGANRGEDTSGVLRVEKEIAEAKNERDQLAAVHKQKLADLVEYKAKEIREEKKIFGDRTTLLRDSMDIEKSYEQLQKDVAANNIENRQEEANRTNEIYKRATVDRQLLEKSIFVKTAELEKLNKDKAPKGNKEAEEALALKRSNAEKELKTSQDLYQGLLSIEKTTGSQMISLNIAAMEERLQKKKTLLDHEVALGRASTADQIQLLKDWGAQEKKLAEERLGVRIEIEKKIAAEKKALEEDKNGGTGSRTEEKLNALKVELANEEGFAKASKENLAQNNRDIEMMTRQNIQNIQRIKIDADQSDKLARTARIEDLHRENELGQYRAEYLEEEYELTARNFEQERQSATKIHEMNQLNIGDAKIKAANDKKFAAEMDDLTHREIQSLRDVKKYYQEVQAAAKEAEIQQIESAKSVLASQQAGLEEKYSRGYDNSKEIEANRKAQEKKAEDEIRINEKVQIQKLEEDQKAAAELRGLYAAEQIKEIEETKHTEAEKLKIKLISAAAELALLGPAEAAQRKEKLKAMKEASEQILALENSTSSRVSAIREELAKTNANTEEATAKKVKDIKTIADNQVNNNRRASLLEDERRQIESASRIAGIRVQKDQEALSKIELNRLQMEENIRSGKSSSLNAFQAEAELSAQVYETQKKLLADTLQEALTHKNIEESRRAQIEYAQGLARLEVDYSKQKRIEEATERSARAEFASKEAEEARAALDFKRESGQLQVTAIRAARMEKDALLESLAAQKKIILAKAEEAIAQDSGINKERIQKDARNQINGAVRDTIKLIQQANQKSQDGNSELDKAVSKYNKIKQALDAIRGNKEEEDEDLKPKEREENTIGDFTETMREDRLKMKLKKAQADIDKATKESFKKASLEYEAYAASHGTSVEEAAKVLTAPAGPMGKLTETMVALTEAVKNQTNTLNGNGAAAVNGPNAGGANTSGANAGGGNTGGANTGEGDTDAKQKPFEISRADRMRMGNRTGEATPDWGEGEYKISRADRMRMGGRTGPATPDWGDGPFTISPEDRVRMRNRDADPANYKETGEWGQGSAADAMAKDKAKQDAKNNPVAVSKSGKDKESGPKDFGPKPFGDEAKNKPEASSDQSYLAQIAAGVSALVQMAGSMKGGGAPAPAPDKKKPSNGGQGPGANPKNFDKNGRANEDFLPYETALNFNRRMPGQFTA